MINYCERYTQLNNLFKLGVDIKQEAGGLIMWVPACMIYLTDILISLGRWYRSDASANTGE